ncbi:DUF2177 family protein [Rhodoferax mekongensis]|uniref:DUF2177 family protein n=1 Tax=Rhodoferax mekongensis TaxID=3068341 RepID=A0ABZ0AZU7_9BURK|nr:DUF2177 family protein [Rhodoferax sp. TBRC 17307]WNO04990.1 DUF2177 family protein [Rhodoferax sp. TBRC 17307]
MNKYLATYAATALVLLMLDVLWIGGLAKSMYQEGICHLMAEQPRWGVAALFYALYPVGLLVFVVAPRGVTDGWSVTLLHAALFGLVAYATYDLTNLATLKGWPVSLAMLDMAWGCVASCAASAAGKLVFQRFA